MPTYKLTYFDARAKAELIRYLFAAAGVEFEDFRIPRDKWPAIKSSTPFGQMPVLEVDGKPLAQSYAISRYLAREFDLAGSNSWEQALCDQYIDLGGVDLHKEIRKPFFEEDESKKEEISKMLAAEVLPKFMGFYNKALESNGGTYLVGNKLSVADLIAVSTFDTALQLHPTAMDAFPKLKAHRARIQALPNIAIYLKNRKYTAM